MWPDSEAFPTLNTLIYVNVDMLQFWLEIRLALFSVVWLRLSHLIPTLLYYRNRNKETHNRRNLWPSLSVSSLKRTSGGLSLRNLCLMALWVGWTVPFWVWGTPHIQSKFSFTAATLHNQCDSWSKHPPRLPIGSILWLRSFISGWCSLVPECCCLSGWQMTNMTLGKNSHVWRNYSIKGILHFMGGGLFYSMCFDANVFNLYLTNEIKLVFIRRFWHQW